MKTNFSCPVCRSVLSREDKTYRCADNHCFDIAKQGYVNLLRSQKSSKKRHGDDTLMVKSRQDFLEKDYYLPLREEIVRAVKSIAGEECTLLDLGCGECWYTADIYRKLTESGVSAQVFGIDISKQTLIYGAKRCSELNLAVASTAEIPLGDESCDVCLCVFAPYSEAEILRVLKKGGAFIKVFPLEDHLMGLKTAIYDKPYKNEVSREIGEGFDEASFVSVMNNIVLTSGEDIMNLFRMTPYYYKTGREDQQKVEKLEYLKTEICFGISVYIKR